MGRRPDTTSLYIFNYIAKGLGLIITSGQIVHSTL